MLLAVTQVHQAAKQHKSHLSTYTNSLLLYLFVLLVVTQVCSNTTQSYTPSAPPPQRPCPALAAVCVPCRHTATGASGCATTQNKPAHTFRTTSLILQFPEQQHNACFLRQKCTFYVLCIYTHTYIEKVRSLYCSSPRPPSTNTSSCVIISFSTCKGSGRNSEKGQLASCLLHYKDVLFFDDSIYRTVISLTLHKFPNAADTIWA